MIMGLFHKGGKKEKQLTKYRITMTVDGKLHEDSKPTVVEIEEDCEFNAIWEAEKKNPHMKVAKCEKAK